jgi:hypothetical protein
VKHKRSGPGGLGGQSPELQSGREYALPKASLFLGKVQNRRGTDVHKEAIQRRTHTRGEHHHTSTTTQMMIMRTMTPNQAKDISSPHRGADSSSDRASSSTNHCARRAGDEKTAGAAEASASQSRRRPPARQRQPTPTYSCDFPPKGKLSAATSNGS